MTLAEYIWGWAVYGTAALLVMGWLMLVFFAMVLVAMKLYAWVERNRKQ